MQSLLYVPSSNQAANASLMTVQTLRSPGATTAIVNTVANVPTKFYGTMGAPHTFTDPVTGETITIISEATAVDAAFSVSGSNIIIDAIAPGYTDTRGSLVGDIIVIKPVTEWANNLYNVLAQSHNNDGTFKNDSITSEAPFVDAVDPVLRMKELMFDHIVAGGGVLAGINYGVTLTASLSAGVCYINGYRQLIAAVASRAYTASKDTYVDALYNASGTATIVYTEVANNAASPALAANSVRLGIVVTGASNIAAATSVNQGQDTALLPTGGAGTYFLMTTDSLGNLICPRDPQRKTLSYRQETNNQTTSSTTNSQVVGLTAQAQVIAGRKIKVSIGCAFLYNSTAGNRANFNAWEGAVASGVQLCEAHGYQANSSSANNGYAERTYTPTTSGLLTFNAGMSVSVAGSTSIEAYANNPGFIKIEQA